MFHLFKHGAGILRVDYRPHDVGSHNTKCISKNYMTIFYDQILYDHQTFIASNY